MNVTKFPVSTNVLKIHRANNTFFSIAGPFVQIKNPEGEIIFDAFEILGGLVRKTKNVRAAFNNYNSEIPKTVDSLFATMPSEVLQMCQASVLGVIRDS
jgi:hypothetical protein